MWIERFVSHLFIVGGGKHREKNNPFMKFGYNICLAKRNSDNDHCVYNAI